MLRRMPGMGAGDGGMPSSGELAGGVGMLMMAAVKSGSPQFSFRSLIVAFRLERLSRETQRMLHFKRGTNTNPLRGVYAL